MPFTIFQIQQDGSYAQMSIQQYQDIPSAQIAINGMGIGWMASYPSGVAMTGTIYSSGQQ